MSDHRRKVKDLDQNSGQSQAQELGQAPPLALALTCDPTERALCESWIHRALDRHHIDLHRALKHPESLPLVWFEKHITPDACQLSIFCIGPFRQRFFKYFYEFCLHIGSKEIAPDPLAYSIIDFTSPRHPSYHRLSLCKIQMQLTTEGEVDHLLASIKASHQHLKTGLWTGNFSDWSIWRQSAAEDERVATLCQRWSDLSVTMPPELATMTGRKLHHLIVTLSKSLLNERNPRHIIDIARSMALPIWKQLSQPKAERSQKRRCWVQHSVRHILSNERPTMMNCYTVTLNYLRSHESLEERHLILAMRQLHLAHGPAHFFTNIRDPETKFHHFYLELPSDTPIEATHRITPQSLQNLSERVLSAVERKQLRIFQPRNDEDSLKRLVTLAKEVQRREDLAQVALSFDQQTDDRLIFHLLIARPTPANPSDLLAVFPSAEMSLKIEKMRKLEEEGLSKQLLLARIEVAKSLFVREDYSVDLHCARIHIMRQLTQALGPVRDYNGGLIAKQHQLLEQILERVGPLANHHHLLLEEVYFSLQPSVAIGNFDPEALALFFNQILNCESHRRQLSSTPRLYWKFEGGYILLVTLAAQSELLERLSTFFQEQLRSGSALIHGEISKTHRYLQYAMIPLEASELNKFKKLLTKQLPNGTQLLAASD